jgi:hypothetical protein
MGCTVGRVPIFEFVGSSVGFRATQENGVREFEVLAQPEKFG